MTKWKAETRFEEWVEFYGQSALATRLGRSRQLVHIWVSEHKRPSDNLKLRIIKLSNGMLKIADFFTDLPENKTEQLK